MAIEKFSEQVTAASLCIRIGGKVRSLRVAKGWSQRMLADHAQIEQAHLARLELGQIEPGVLVLERLAGALEVDVWELLR